MMVAINAGGRVKISGGNRDFVHIFNNVAGETRTLLVHYDGTSITAANMLTKAVRLLPGTSLLLTNSGAKPIFNRDIWLTGTEAGDVLLSEMDISVLGVASSEVTQSSIP